MPIARKVIKATVLVKLQFVAGPMVGHECAPHAGSRISDTNEQLMLVQELVMYVRKVESNNWAAKPPQV